MIRVIKRDGRVERLDITKIQKYTRGSVEGLKGVSQSVLEVDSNLHFRDMMSTKDIQQTLIKTAVDKIAQVSKEVDRAVKNVDTTLQRGDYNIKEMAAPTLEEIDEMIYEIKVLLSQMQRAVSSIEESPSDLLFKSSKKRLGPGERE